MSHFEPIHDLPALSDELERDLFLLKNNGFQGEEIAKSFDLRSQLLVSDDYSLIFC